MGWFDRIVVAKTRLLAKIISALGLGAGATWPGEIAITLSPNMFRSFASTFREGIIIVAGTNGKTTTSLMISQILRSQGKTVVHNDTGANLLNGIVSACIRASDWRGSLKADWGVFEVDENTLPMVLQYCHSREGWNREEKQNGSPIRSGMTKRIVIVLLNLFRDQLDRYGEVDVIVEKWKKALSFIVHRSSFIDLIVNADDPGVAYIGLKSALPVTYFGVNDKTKFLSTKEHATDSTFCPKCGARLIYEGVYLSHIGVWKCASCSLQRPKPDVSRFPSPLPGLYNQYNTLAAVAATRAVGISDKHTRDTLASFGPAFGRQEEITIDGKTVKLFLSKNPAGFNASIRAVMDLRAKHLLIVLNDRIPDGRDVSWIWDVDFEVLRSVEHVITVSGDRAWDMALRLKYAEGNNKFVKLKVHNVRKVEKNEVVTEPDLSRAIKKAFEMMKSKEVLYVLATYSGMLEVRRILTGRKIL